MNKIHLVIFCLVTWNCYALHLEMHDDATSYMSKLSGQQTSFTSKLQSLQSDIQKTKSSLGSETDLDAKIKLLEQALIRQKKQLTTISIELIPPMSELTWQCFNLKNTTMQELRSQADNVKTETGKLDTIINGMKGKQTPQSVQNSASAVLYAKKVRQSLDTDVSFIGTGTNPKIGYVSNLSGPKWTPGGLTNPEVNQKIKGNKTKYDIIKQCPSQTPFFNGVSCISCSSDQIFNLQSNNCQGCSNFDSSSRVCLSSPNVYKSTNVDAGKSRLILPSGVTLDDLRKNNDHPCPSNNPFFANNNCIDCTSPNTLFDYKNSQCVSCQKNQIYSPDKYQCLRNGGIKGTNYPIAGKRLIIPEGQTLLGLQQAQSQLAKTQNINLCPKQSPFFNTNTNKCVNCQQGTYFNVKDNQCVKCKSGFNYLERIHRCESGLIYSNFANQNWTSTNPQKVKKDNEQIKAKPNSQSCPIQTPFFDGSKCVSCQNDKIFSFDTHTCTECSKGTFFSINLHQCLKPEGAYQTNPMKAPHLIYGGVSKAEWSSKYYKNLETNPNIADCPTQRPYFQGTVCIKCPTNHPYFNLSYRLCQSCEASTTYNENTHQCLSTAGNIIDQTPNLEKMAAGIFA